MIVKTNAKINLTLDIVGKRQDGYHLIDSVFQSVSLYDEIEMNKADNISVCFEDVDINGSESIAYKAAKAFFDYTTIKSGVKIKIKSQIPTSSGLGGGSSDAAGVLVGLNRLFGANLNTKTLCDIGSKIGADVPFCIVGGTARVGGIGEIINPLPLIPEQNIVILKHGQKLSTADMYGKLDNMPIESPNTTNMVKAIESGNSAEIFNSISNAFCAVNDIKFEEKLLKDLGAIKVGLSGSGPSVFGIFSDFEASALAYITLKDLGYNVFCAKTESNSIIIE